ncbi:MAG: hypothetical protein QM773_13335 [Hyphomonadaceae bacterium]
MSVQRSLAKVLMGCAALLAPRDKAEWLHAMRAEFAMAGNAQALSWAAGCLGTSLLWRIREEAVFLIAITVVIMAYEPAIIFAIEHVIGEHSPVDYLFGMTHLTEQTYLALATFFLGIYRPRRLLLTAALMPLSTTIIPIAAQVWSSNTSSWDIPERLWWTYWFAEGVATYICWPVIPAALLAFGFNWWMRARRSARG